MTKIKRENQIDAWRWRWRRIDRRWDVNRLGIDIRLPIRRLAAISGTVIIIAIGIVELIVKAVVAMAETVVVPDIHAVADMMVCECRRYGKNTAYATKGKHYQYFIGKRLETPNLRF